MFVKMNLYVFTSLKSLWRLVIEVFRAVDFCLRSNSRSAPSCNCTNSLLFWSRTVNNSFRSLSNSLLRTTI